MSSPRAKLTPKQRVEIVTRFEKGERLSEIARAYDISPTTAAYWVRKKKGDISFREWNETQNPKTLKRKKLIEKAKAQYAKGVSVADIAAKNGWGLSTAYRYMNVAPHRKPTSDWITGALEDFENGMTVKEIAKKVGRTHSTVSGSLALRMGMSPTEYRQQQRQDQKDNAALAKKGSAGS